MRFRAVVGVFVALALAGCGSGAKGIAWTVPDGERADAAQGLDVITSARGVLRSRDAFDGDLRWKQSVPDSVAHGQISIDVDNVIDVATDGSLYVFDTSTGQERWHLGPAEITIPAVSNDTILGITRCSGSDCRIEARDLVSGHVEWRAPMSSQGWFLGAPTGGPRPQVAGVWPTDFALVLDPRDAKRYAVRELATGKVVARGHQAADGGAQVINGGWLVRAKTTVHSNSLSDATTVIEATGLTGGNLNWRTETDGAPAQIEDDPGDPIVVADHAIPIVGLYGTFPVPAPETFVALDAHTGRLIRTPSRVSGDHYELARTGPPAVDESTVEEVVTGVAPVVVAGSDIQAGARVFHANHLSLHSVWSTEDQVGWVDDSGAVVRDRRTGKAVARYKGDDVSVAAIGDRLVIRDGDTDRIVRS